MALVIAIAFCKFDLAVQKTTLGFHNVNLMTTPWIQLLLSMAGIKLERPPGIPWTVLHFSVF